MFCSFCEGISKSILCNDVSGKLMLFNKPIEKDKFNKIYEELVNFNWYPKFNNAFVLKGNLEWYETNIPEIAQVSNKAAYSDMPLEMIKYIKSLDEYDEELFKKITELEL